MGSPPLGLPARVARRMENQVTGVRARTDRRSLETRELNATGSRQTHRGHVTGRIGVEPRSMVRVASALRGAHTHCHTCSPEHEHACVRLYSPLWYNHRRREAQEGKKWDKGLDNSGNI